MNANPIIQMDSSPVQAGELSLQYLRELAEDFFAHLNERTRRTYEQALRDFAGFIGESEIHPALMHFLTLSPFEAYRLALRYQTNLRDRNLSASTINTRSSALRKLVQFMHAAGVIQWELKIKNVRQESYRDTRGPGNKGYRALLKVAESQKPEKATRDIAILYLLHFMGLRRNEVASLDLSDVDLDRSTLAVLGKRRSEKILLTIPDRTKEALQRWIKIRGDAEGALFHNLNHATDRRTRLSGEGLRQLVAGLGRKAGIKVSPHGLRHLAITNVLDMGVGIREAQRFSRHASPDTLLKYDDNREDLAGKVAQQLEDLLA